MIPNLPKGEAVILRLLAGGELYGLELVRASDGQIKRGTIYVTLHRMEDKGRVRSRRARRGPDQSGIARRLYKATDEGRRLLAAYEAAREAYEGSK